MRRPRTESFALILALFTALTCSMHVCEVAAKFTSQGRESIRWRKYVNSSSTLYYFNTHDPDFPSSFRCSPTQEQTPIDSSPSTTMIISSRTHKACNLNARGIVVAVGSHRKHLLSGTAIVRCQCHANAPQTPPMHTFAFAKNASHDAEDSERGKRKRTKEGKV